MKRLIGLDIIRCLAILFVIAGHFFSINTPYKKVPFEGLSMFLQGMFSVIFYTGVPLFMMITGFLNCHKEACTKYFKGIYRVLAAYIVFSIITIVFRNIFLMENKSTLQWIQEITSFSAIPYTWYIEMWIGLFFLTPFLNRLYKAIPTKKEKIIGLLILYAMSALPDFFNRYGFYLVPAYWTKAAYPLLFFYLGTYIRENQPRITYRKGLIIIGAISCIQPIFNILFMKGHDVVEIIGGPGGIFLPVIAITIFIMCYQIELRNHGFIRFVNKCSVVSLHMYLCCYIFDKIVYTYFIDYYYINQSQFGLYFCIIIPIIFITSFLCGLIYERIISHIKNSLHI